MPQRVAVFHDYDCRCCWALRYLFRSGANWNLIYKSVGCKWSPRITFFLVHQLKSKESLRNFTLTRPFSSRNLYSQFTFNLFQIRYSFNKKKISDFRYSTYAFQYCILATIIKFQFSFFTLIRILDIILCILEIKLKLELHVNLAALALAFYVKQDFKGSAF